MGHEFDVLALEAPSACTCEHAEPAASHDLSPSLAPHAADEWTPIGPASSAVESSTCTLSCGCCSPGETNAKAQVLWVR